MPVSDAREGSLAEQELKLLWGAWVELGVSSWQRTHGNWVVDPEPLIIRTATVGDVDPRLRDEALDWCIHYSRYVSRVRLRNLLRDLPESSLEAWGRFAATVNAHATVRWPGGTQKLRYKITGRSSLDSLERPSRAWIRLRAMFGLGARTEILRFFLAQPQRDASAIPRRATVSAIAESAGYAKRNVADECDILEKAGLLNIRQVRNRFYYSLAREVELRQLVGPMADVRPDWTAVLRVTSTLGALEASARTLPIKALMVEAHRAAETLDDVLDDLGIENRPTLTNPDSYWTEVRDFATELLSNWAAGRWISNDRPRPVQLRRKRATS